jgi:hypothetical protein
MQRGNAHMLGSASASHLMALAPSAVHVDTALSNFLIMYENREYIADIVSPVVTVTKRSDKIFAFASTTLQQIANADMASNRGRPSEATYSITSTNSYSVRDYGLIDFVSQDEEMNADAPLQPRVISAEVLMNFLMLHREYRVATNTVFASGSYGANTTALTGGNRWDTATGTPVQNILDWQETPFVQPTHLVLGGQVWPKFRNNAEVKSYVVSRASTSLGDVPFLVDADVIARAFGLERCVVGRAKYNSAAEGLTAVSSYVWGKSAALIRVEAQPNARKTQTFTYTYRFGPIVNQVIPELIAGTRGGVWVKIAHSDDDTQVIAGADGGYLGTTVVS